MSYKSLRSDTIKIIAMISMFLDHFGAAVIGKIILTSNSADIVQNITPLYQFLRGVGRIAMPIFCYQLSRGFLYTHSRIKYLRNVFIFALISEIPFNLIDSGTIQNPKYQNTMFTLFLGLMTLMVLDIYYSSDFYIEKHKNEKDKIYTIAVNTVVTATFSIVAELLKTDYGAKAVILIVLFYFMRENTYQMTSVCAAIFLVEVFIISYLRYKNMTMTINYCESEVMALLAFPIIALDSGRRKGGRAVKAVGYVFYPAHLMLVYLISLLI